MGKFRRERLLIALSATATLATLSASAQLDCTPMRLLNAFGTADSRHDEYPQVATDGLGHWVAVWYSGEDYNGAGTDNDIFVSRSIDNGHSWTAPDLLNTNGTTDTGNEYVPQVTTDGMGNWVAVWRSDGDLMGGRRSNEIFVARSSDNGATWTPPAFLYADATADTRFGHVPQVATDGLGRWVAVWQTYLPTGSFGSESDIAAAYSVDNGMSWSEPILVNSYADTDTGMDEQPQIATDGLGNWVAVWWSNENYLGSGTDFDLLVSRSSDGGATWSDAEFINTYATTDTAYDGNPEITTDGEGQWFVVWNSDENVAGSGTDFDILISKSVDEGATWSVPGLLNANATTDIGGDRSPQIARDGANRWIAVWQSPENIGGAGFDADVFISVSEDDCVSWSYPELLNSNATADSLADIAPQITSDGMGNWIAVWYTSQDELGSGNDYDIFLTSPPADADPPIEMPVGSYWQLALLVGALALSGGVRVRRGAAFGGKPDVTGG